jgi:hypothetical protein
MGVTEAIAAIRKTWYTLSGSGQPAYRSGVDVHLEAVQTAKQYGVTYSAHQYIEPDKQALAYA